MAVWDRFSHVGEGEGRGGWGLGFCPTPGLTSVTSIGAGRPYITLTRNDRKQEKHKTKQTQQKKNVRHGSRTDCRENVPDTTLKK